MESTPPEIAKTFNIFCNYSTSAGRTLLGLGRWRAGFGWWSVRFGFGNRMGAGGDVRIAITTHDRAIAIRRLTLTKSSGRGGAEILATLCLGIIATVENIFLFIFHDIFKKWSLHGFIIARGGCYNLVSDTGFFIQKAQRKTEASSAALCHWAGGRAQCLQIFNQNRGGAGADFSECLSACV